MRINKYLASYGGLSRRAADAAIDAGQVLVNNQEPSLGYEVQPSDVVTLDGNIVVAASNSPTTIILNKPIGYVVSRDGQGSKTIYDLLPQEYLQLKPVGRLDKDSSGLLLLTNDGQLAYELTHPKFQKTKVYKIALNKPLAPEDHNKIHAGVTLEDGISKLQLESINKGDNSNWKVTMFEGRNRQIRRTFSALGYKVIKLHRVQFGNYQLKDLAIGQCRDA